jgi:hypothetical protein
VIILLLSNMNVKDHDSAVQIAIEKLEKGVSRIVKRADKSASTTKWKRRIHSLIEHTRFLLMELFKKRESLLSFLQWFKQEWKRIEGDLPKDPVQILQHTMQSFLRCQDGLVLLTSGECRHAYDIQRALQTNFPSKLPTLKKRNDGYTYLYKSDAVYSGTGWDEYANDTVGLKARLIAELQQFNTSPWELLEKYNSTDLLESLLDQQEGHVKEIQHGLQQMKSTILNDINQRLKPKNLKFATQDKMERLSLLYQERSIDLSRRADSFQIEGPLLPEDRLRPEQWTVCALSSYDQQRCSSPSNRKRRRIVEDSDSDIEADVKIGSHVVSNKPSKRKNSAGLVVLDRTSQTGLEREDSVAAIKVQLGIDNQGLENARIGLEDEDMCPVVSYETDEVVRCKKILNRACSRQVVDDDEVWDARECLRRALMDAGSYSLWTSKDSASAVERFKEANTLVVQQIEAHRQATGTLADSDSISLFIQRNLLYLQAQAAINIGISFIEFSQYEKATTKSKLLQGIKEIEKVRLATGELREIVNRKGLSGGKDGRISVEEMSDMLKVDQLDSMAYRWAGVGMWHLGQESKSVEALDKAYLYFNEQTVIRWHQSLEEEAFELAAECLYATYILADLASSKMEQYQHSRCWKEGDAMLEVVNRALTRNIDICNCIAGLECKWLPTEYFFREYDIRSPNDIIRRRKEIEKWWSNAKGTSKIQRSLGSSNDNLERVSVARSYVSVGLPGTTVSLLLTSDVARESTKRWTKKRQGAGFQSGHDVPSRPAGPARDCNHVSISDESYGRPTKFRKWGNDNFAQMVSNYNNSISLTYPSCVPPIPEEFKHLIYAQPP